MSVMKTIRLMLGSATKEPSTRMFPQTERIPEERTRGHITIDADDCILCGICSKRCPAEAITVSKQDRTWTIERMSCVQCGYCVESCPKSCLSMANEYTEPDTEKVRSTVSIPERKKEEKASAGGSGSE